MEKFGAFESKWILRTSALASGFFSICNEMKIFLFFSMVSHHCGGKIISFTGIYTFLLHKIIDSKILR